MAKKIAKTADKPEDGERIEVKSTPKVNDVAKPGETPSSPTSRPVIIGRGGMIKQDPMVSGKPDEDDAQTVDEPGKVIRKKTELKLQPTDSNPDHEEPIDKEPDDNPPENKEEPAKTEKDPEEKSPKDKTEEEHSDDNETSESAAIDSLATSAESKKTTTKEAEEEQKKADKLQELIESKKYNVAIVEGGHRASNQRVLGWVILFLLLIAVGLYLAADAGYLDIGVSLPFDLIKN